MNDFKGEDIIWLEMSEIIKENSYKESNSFTAKVIKGRQIGRKIGFPTANLDILGKPMHLNQGVYGVRVTVSNVVYFGIMNVGKRPTFKEKDPFLHYEVHILDFDKNLYGERLIVDICFFIREEKTFLTVNHLKKQIQQDKVIALKSFKIQNN